MNKPLIGAAVATAIVAAGVAGVTAVHAQENSSGTENNPESSLISKIASTFKLDKAAVQKVFDEERTSREQARETKWNEKLAELVKNGKLTQDQADKIKAKREEMKKEMEASKPQPGQTNSKSHEDRKADMESRKTALDKWMSDNQIPTEYRYLVMGGGHGMGGPGGKGGPGQPGGQARESEAQPADEQSTATTNS